MRKNKVYQITLKDRKESFFCGEDENIMAAMLRQRRGHVRCGCFGGGCGICRMRIITGAYQQIRPMSKAHITGAEQAEGYVLLCCVEPRSDIILVNEKSRQKDIKGELRWDFQGRLGQV